MAGMGVGMDHADRSAAAPMMIDRVDGSLNGAGTLRSLETAATIEQFENVYGPSARDIKLDNQRHKRHQRWHLPDVLKGPNNYLTDRVDGLITDATNSPFTRNILPYVYMDTPDQKITWNVYSFDEGMASRVPYESAARVLPQSKRSYKGYIVRSGLAIQMEHNFMASEAGRLNFKRQLQQLVGSVQLTNDYDVHIALLTAPSYQREMDEKYMETDNNFAQCCRQYADMFGMLNKTPNALDILIEDAKKHVKLWGGQPPTFMLCNGAITASLTMLPEKTNYLTNGPDGARRLAQGPELPSYRGLSIINTRQFQGESGARPRDMLRRRVRVGQYYFITDPAYDAGDESPNVQARKNTSYEFYDQSKDGFFKMTYEELRAKALKHHADRDGEYGSDFSGGGEAFVPVDYERAVQADSSCKKLGVLMDLLATGRADADRKNSSYAFQASFADMKQKWTSVNTAVQMTRLAGSHRNQASNQLLQLYSNNEKDFTGQTAAFQQCETAWQNSDFTEFSALSQYNDAWVSDFFAELADVAARISLKQSTPRNIIDRQMFKPQKERIDYTTLAQIIFNHLVVENFDGLPYVYRDSQNNYQVDYKDFDLWQTWLCPSQIAYKIIEQQPVSTNVGLIFDDEGTNEYKTICEKVEVHLKNHESAALYRAYGMEFKEISNTFDTADNAENMRVVAHTYDTVAITPAPAARDMRWEFFDRYACVSMKIPGLTECKILPRFKYKGANNVNPFQDTTNNAPQAYGGFNINIPRAQANQLYTGVDVFVPDDDIEYYTVVQLFALLALLDHQFTLTNVAADQAAINQHKLKISDFIAKLEIQGLGCILPKNASTSTVNGNSVMGNVRKNEREFEYNIDEDELQHATHILSVSVPCCAFARFCISRYILSTSQANSNFETLANAYLSSHDNANQYLAPGIKMQSQPPRISKEQYDETRALVLLGDDRKPLSFFTTLSYCASRRIGFMFSTAIHDKIDYYTSPSAGGGAFDSGKSAGKSKDRGPVDLLLVRPNIEHNMLGAIVARGGTQELGSTFWGQTEMSCYDDAQHGIWGMSYKYHAKALVTNNKNMMRLFDIAFDGYCGGMDATFVDASRESLDAFRDASFNRTEAYSGDSFLVFELPRNSQNSKAPRLPNPVTWNWAGLIEDTSKAKAAPDRGDVMCRDQYKHNLMHATSDPNSGIIDAAARAALANSLQLLGMDNLQHHITTTTGPPGHNIINNMTDLNNIFYHGYLAVYDGQGNRKSLTKGSGHLGPCWEGVASVREGRGLPQPAGMPQLQHLV